MFTARLSYHKPSRSSQRDCPHAFIPETEPVPYYAKQYGEFECHHNLVCCVSNTLPDYMEVALYCN